MTPTEFVQWLKGFSQAVGADPARMPTLPQWTTILGQLTKVSEVNGAFFDTLKRECDKRDEAQAKPFSVTYEIGGSQYTYYPPASFGAVIASDLPERG